jgi:hypothetical protein
MPLLDLGSNAQAEVATAPAPRLGRGQGVLLVATAEPGLAAVFRLVRHASFRAGASAADLSLLASKEPATAQWFGWYSSSVLANGWQPYDQPHPAAYIPLAFETVGKLELSGGGALVRQIVPEATSKVWAQSRSTVLSCSEEELPDVLREQLMAVGFEHDDADEAVRFLLSGARDAVNAA